MFRNTVSEMPGGLTNAILKSAKVLFEISFLGILKLHQKGVEKLKLRITVF